MSTAIGVGLLVGASFLDGVAQGALWALALLLDMGGPYFFGAEGWKLVPGHFAERHGLIIIIALGESIVAIGVGAEADVDRRVIAAAAVVGIALAAAIWWAYFDVVALVAARRLARASRGPRAERAGPRLLLVPALPDGRRDRARRAGAEEDARRTSTTRWTSCPPSRCWAASRIYLLGLVGFRYRHVHTVNRQRLAARPWRCSRCSRAAVELPGAGGPRDRHRVDLAR